MSPLKLYVASTITFIATTASAQMFGVESDAADRIRISSQLGTLTQQVAAASCAVTSDVDVDEALQVLEDATKMFDRYIVALKDGDEGLHILAPEERRRTLADIEHVNTEWQAIHGAIDNILMVDQHDIESAHLIDDHNLTLLKLTSILASDIAAQYANPHQISTADAFAMELAGRQRMLTQKMAKDACEIWTGYHSKEAKTDLAETMVIFENSLMALRHGMPAVGIVAAKDETIKADLDDLLQRWAALKVNLQTLVAGGELNEDQKYEVFHDLEVELAALDNLLADYKDYAERAH